MAIDETLIALPAIFCILECEKRCLGQLNGCGPNVGNEIPTLFIFKSCYAFQMHFDSSWIDNGYHH